MAKKQIKYKIMYLHKNEDNKKPLNVLMEEAETGFVITCDSSKQIESELHGLKQKGWALKVKSEVVGWGYVLYMEKVF